jgi:hypothetical protein
VFQLDAPVNVENIVELVGGSVVPTTVPVGVEMS